MGRNRILLAVSVVLAALGSVVLASGVGDPVATTVQLSQGDATSTTITLTLGDGTDPSTTSTSAPATTTSTTEQATTTSTLALPVTTTSMSTSTSTSTTMAPNTALVRVVNSFTSTVQFTVNDATSHTWTLAPGETAGPWAIVTSTEHNDDATVTDPATLCGIEQMGPFFEPGHSVLITVERAGVPCEAQAGPVSGPMFVVLDETTGTSTVVGVPAMPTTG